MEYKKYKDDLPINTIEKIKKIYSGIGLEMDTQEFKRMDGVFSSYIIDINNGWSTSGKGTTPEFCLASGFAESIEHLCSYCSYDSSLLTQESKEYLNFIRYPDEKRIKIEEIEKYCNNIYEEMKEAYTLDGEIFNKEKMYEAWKYCLNDDYTSLVPYYSVKTKKYVYLPEAIIGKLCGSTGGGAGNSIYEAIGHGLDEISERYVKYIIYSNELTPPEIKHEFVKKSCPDLYKIIESVEKDNRFKVIIKDASLGKGYPVVAVAIIDIYLHEYVVNFGSHPCFSIALERCLTEMFQFMSLDKFEPIKHKRFEKWKADSRYKEYFIRNWVSLLRDDTGIVPNSFFSKNNSWDFKPWGIYHNYDNKMGMNLQINNFINDNVDDIYIRDLSFLDFPVYRIYIPSISTSHITINLKMMEDYQKSKLIISDIFDDKKTTLSNNELIVLERTFSRNSFIDTWILKDVREDFLDLLHEAILKDLKSEKYDLRSIKNTDYYDAIIYDSKLESQNISISERNQFINLFYGEFYTGIVKSWREKNTFINILKTYKEIYFPKKIKTTNSKKIENINKLHKKIKEKMLINSSERIELNQILKTLE